MSDNNYYENTAPIISFIGCDGSGKSTLSHDIAQILNKERKTEIFYLGLGSGELGRRIQKWPIVGKYIERVLSNKAKKTRSPTERIPGPVTAFVVFLFSCKRFLEFNKMYATHKNGIQVVTDRYPQNELRALLEIRYDRFSRGFERDSKAGCGRQHNEAAWPELHARRNAIRLI
ncbi:hypothetical protein [Acetobacter oryzoeni]|uniref:hypothetical protein n=1 Tax=Acetobacter oryzoeni TaxID=2500548 RepID=UPI003DA852E1